MPWFMIDDGFWSHPKTLQLSDGAQALWVRAGSWSMKHMTDGFIPDYALPVLSAKPRFVNELRAVSLWFSVEGGNQFHDWLEYQRSREALEEDRRAAAERKRKSREKSRRDTPRDSRSDSPVGVTPTPSQPIPTKSSSTKKTTTAARGSRLDPDWTPSPELIAQMRAECGDVDLKAQHAVFVDYWIAQPGQKGVKTDWDATWRNWMRRKQSEAPSKPSTRGQENLAFLQRLEQSQKGITA